MFKNKFFIAFLFLFFLFNINSVVADTIECSVVNGCGANQASCGLDIGISCNCGTGVASCQDMGTIQCAGPNGGDAMTCWAGERCECAPPVVISGCTDPGATNYNPNASVDDGSCTYPSPPPNCGNGVVNAGEQCDLGINNGSCPGGCSLSCTFINCNPPAPTCGNGSIDPGEQCDTGVNNGSCPRTCSNSCTVNSCGGTTRTLTFTASGPGTALGYTSTAAGQPLTYAGSCRGGTCVIALPVNTYVTIDAVHDIFGGAFNWQAVCPALGVGARCEGSLNADYSAGVTFVGVTTPVVNNISISSSDINPNGTQYTVTAVASDSGGGNKINQQYALINHQGTNAGQYRGYLTWASYSFAGNKDAMSCSGGGYAAIQSTGGNTVYGHDYIELHGCSTTVNGGTRTTTFNVSFNPLFGTNGPWTLNDISGYTSNTDNNWNGWVNFDINFALITTPTSPTVTISSPTVFADNSTQYQITVNSTDSRGGGNISHEYALINYQGSNSGQYRGYVTWYFDSLYSGWNALKNKMSCTGGGVAAIQTGYGDTYLNLDSCTNTINGNTRTTVFNVRFDSSFINPLTNNDISGFVQNKFGNNTNWVNSDINFSLNTGVPTVVSPTVSGITTTGATLGANVTSLGVPAAISARGTCWGTVNPPVTNCTPASGLTTGVFTHARTGMPSGTTIYYRGYATNTTGTGYSTVSSFTTTSVPAPTLSASPSSIAPGGTVTVTFANVPTPTVRDWIGMYILGNTGNSFLDWKYEGVSPCTQTVPGSSRSSGSCTFTAPVTPGNYNFRLWDNDNILVQHAVSNTVTVTAPSTYTLTVNVNPVNGGRITGPGINCGADCSESVSAGSNITLTAVPSSSYWKFTGWSGACSGTSTTCNITVNADTSVTANFTPRAFIYREF